jgi:hypothetical protein
MIIILPLDHVYEMRQAMICERIAKTYLDLQSALYIRAHKNKSLEEEKFRNPIHYLLVNTCACLCCFMAHALLVQKSRAVMCPVSETRCLSSNPTHNIFAEPTQ